MATPTPRLWTPIANALEAYRRRVVMEPEAEYEHIWRLIHIQEALAVTLASLMATRLAFLLGSPGTQDCEGINSLREAITGVRADSVNSADENDSEPSSAWGGSVGAWIELLRRFGKVVAATDPFLVDLANYLTFKPNRSLAFAEAWARIAPVPDTFRDPAQDRLGRLGAINSFRNKLAHVPVPQRLLGDLHRGLRVEVLDGLTDKFNPETQANWLGFVATSFRDPLVGVLYCGKAYVTGASEVGIDADRNSDESELRASYGKGPTTTGWPVEPFFLIDREAKTALLFRVTDLRREPGATGYSGEYHRFAAELDPVFYVTIPADSINPWLPETPTSYVDVVSAVSVQIAHDKVEIDQGIYQVNDGIPKTHSSTELRRLAEEAFYRRNYGSAVSLFDKLAELGNEYYYNDVARSKHGAALWRAAEQNESGLDLERSLRRSVELLKSAERHRDSRYAARAAYEGSKALWHLWRSTKAEEHLFAALEAAERAVDRSPDETFISWQARVKADVNTDFPHGLSDEHSASALGGQFDDLYQLSKEHNERGRYVQAAELAQKAININEKNSDAWRQLAIARDQLGAKEQARDAWRRYSELVAQGTVNFGLKAQDALLDARANWASPAAWGELGRAAKVEGRGVEAIAEARRVLADHPQAHTSLLPLVKELLTEEPRATSALLAEMRKMDESNALYIHLCGVALRKENKNEDALDLLQTACKYEPLNANYWYGLGRCSEDMQDLDGAREAFLKAVTCGNPPHRKAQERLRALGALGDVLKIGSE